MDALLVANAGDVVKPYGFIGMGIAKLTDDYDIVSSGSGAGLAFGAGSKFYFGQNFIMMAEVSHHDYQVEGDYAFSPSHVAFLQLRLGLGARF